MAKRIHIEQEDDYQYNVIGIASDEPIWKLCWEINKDLALKLTKKEVEELENPDTDTLAGRLIPMLFDAEEMEGSSEVGYYEDTESHIRLEIALFDNPQQIAPKEARPFRFLFLLRTEGDESPELSTFLSQLNNLNFILSAVDISHIKNIKQIIR